MTVSKKEEKEVKKNKEWAFIELGKLFPSHAEMHDFPDDITAMKCELLNKVYDILSQLDKPEVLSQEWIGENVEYAYFDMLDGSGRLSSATAIIKPKKLQNLLVPKQELPVIPKFVADWIEENKKKNRSLVFAIKHIYDENEIGKSPKFFIWMETDDNEEVFARAWLDGYTVEKEPLYRARLKVITDEFIASYLRTQSSDAEDRLKALEIGSKYIHEDYRHLSEFTEDELKRLDIWDSKQWELEEMEE